MITTPVVSAQSLSATPDVTPKTKTKTSSDASTAAESFPSPDIESEKPSSEPSGQLCEDPDDEEISENTANSEEDENDSNQDSWIDSAYDSTNETLQNFAFGADNFLADEQEEGLPTLKGSRFNFAIDTQVEDKGGLQFNLDLDIRADIRLPKTKERFGLFINTSAPDELPGENPDEVDNPVLVGLELISAFRRVPYLRSYAGFRVNLSPAFFTGMVFRPTIKWDNFRFIPQQKVFWFSDDDGFGGYTSFMFDWLPKDKLLLRSLSAARYTEATDGIEFEQSFLIGFSTKGSFKNIDRGHGIKLSAFGHKSGSFVMDSYRIAYIYRRNIFKKWFFIQLGPEVNFYDEEDWDASPGFRFGFDVLFWTPEDLDV